MAENQSESNFSAGVATAPEITMVVNCHCAKFKLQPKLAFTEVVMGEDDITDTSPVFNIAKRHGMEGQLEVINIAVGDLEVLEDNDKWSLLHLFVKCTPLHHEARPPDVSICVAMPSSWTKTMYIAALLSLYDNADSFEWLSCEEAKKMFFEKTLKVGNRLFYTVRKVEMFFGLSNRRFRKVCKGGLKRAHDDSEKLQAMNAQNRNGQHRMFFFYVKQDVGQLVQTWYDEKLRTYKRGSTLADFPSTKNTPAELLSLRNSEIEIERETSPHTPHPAYYQVQLDCPKLVFDHVYRGTDFLYETSDRYDMVTQERQNMRVVRVGVGDRISMSEPYKRWSLCQLVLTCTPERLGCPPDIGMVVAFPASWSRKMYLAALVETIDNDQSALGKVNDNDDFVLRIATFMGNNTASYTVGNVDRLFDLSAARFRSCLANSLEVVEQQTTILAEKMMQTYLAGLPK